MASLKNNVILFIFMILCSCTQKDDLIDYKAFQKGNEVVYRQGRLGCNKNKQVELWFKDRNSIFYSGLYDTTDLRTITSKVEELLPKGKKYTAFPTNLREYLTKEGKCVSCLIFYGHSEEKPSMVYEAYVAFINDTISDIKILEHYQDIEKTKIPCNYSVLHVREKGIFLETDYFKDCFIDRSTSEPFDSQLVGFHLKSTIWKIDEKIGKFIFLGNVKGTVNRQAWLPTK